VSVDDVCDSPEAVNISNMAALVDADGKPHFKYIVEGANLFLTQQARLHLEKRKVILFKDSSANKGMPIVIVYSSGAHIILQEASPVHLWKF
jgi:glutamate dehydrogenase/leucine dehydrogenase